MVTKIHASMVTALEALVESKVAELSGGKVDIGDYVLSPAASKPKFLKCDGGAYSRATYADLFAVIGTTFGAGDGSTTFNVPNASAQFLLTAGSYPGLTERVVGARGGEERIFFSKTKCRRIITLVRPIARALILTPIQDLMAKGPVTSTKAVTLRKLPIRHRLALTLIHSRSTTLAAMTRTTICRRSSLSGTCSYMRAFS